MMPTCTKRLNARWLALACLCLAIAWPGPGRAEDTATLDKVVGLNRKALQIYQDLDMETAAKLLKQAIELCNLEGLERHRALARSHVHLGVVYVSGLGQRDEGLEEFRRALAIDPTIKITRAVSTPDLQAVFAEAAAKSGEARAALRPLLSTKAAAPPAGAGRDAAINHPPVTEAVTGKAVEIKAQIPRSLRADRIVLAYRVDKQGEFLARELRPVPGAPDWFHEKIPADATTGKSVSYYIEAQDDDGQPLLASGTGEAPHLIRILSEAEEAAENVGAGKGEPARDLAGTPLWFVLAAGAGAGYFSSTPEMNQVDDSGRALKASGTELAALGHLAPEFGYFHSEHLLFSVQARVQWVTGGQDVSLGGKTYKTSSTALAGLAKVSYFFRDASARFQPFVAAQAGAGEIRYPVKTAPLQGCGPAGAAGSCKDTVRGGLGLFGAAAGFAYMLGESVGLYASLGGLLGAPNFALDADLNVGVAVIR